MWTDTMVMAKTPKLMKSLGTTAFESHQETVVVIRRFETQESWAVLTNAQI